MQNRRDELQNNFDDARLALLMDEFCEEEGAKLLMECDALNSDPDAMVPEALHRRLQETVDRHFAAEERARKKTAARRVFKRILIVAAIATVLFTTAFATVETFRIRVMNMTLDVQELYSTLKITMDPPEKSDYVPDSSDSPAPVTNFVFGDGRFAAWIPDGNEVLDDINDEYGALVYLKSTLDESRFYLQTNKIVEGQEFQVDTENADKMTDIEINGNQGYLIRKDDRNHFIWIDLEQSWTFEVITYGHSVNTGLAIAESVVCLTEVS